MEYYLMFTKLSCCMSKKQQYGFSCYIVANGSMNVAFLYAENKGKVVFIAMQDKVSVCSLYYSLHFSQIIGVMCLYDIVKLAYAVHLLWLMCLGNSRALEAHQAH